MRIKTNENYKQQQRPSTVDFRKSQQLPGAHAEVMQKLLCLRGPLDSSLDACVGECFPHSVIDAFLDAGRHSVL